MTHFNIDIVIVIVIGIGIVIVGAPICEQRGKIEYGTGALQATDPMLLDLQTATGVGN